MPDLQSELTKAIDELFAGKPAQPTPSVETTGQKTQRELIFNFLRGSPSSPYTDVAAATGVPLQKVASLLSIMHNEGLVTRVRYGRAYCYTTAVDELPVFDKAAHMATLHLKRKPKAKTKPQPKPAAKKQPADDVAKQVAAMPLSRARALYLHLKEFFE